jgi:hypothetical protein
MFEVCIVLLPVAGQNLQPRSQRRRYGKARIWSEGSVAEDYPMNWRIVRLELGRTCDFPAGSVSRSFLINLPLDESDHVDTTAIERSPSRATVRRHWSTDPDERGTLVRAGEDWALKCKGRPDRLLQLDGTPIRLGRKVSVVEADGTVLPMTVASVR